VAVKIVTHASSEEPRISRELALTLPLEHPHLVRTLHFARMSIRPSPNATPVSGCVAQTGRNKHKNDRQGLWPVHCRCLTGNRQYKMMVVVWLQGVGCVSYPASPQAGVLAAGL
jgi:hypothetical protein